MNFDPDEILASLEDARERLVHSYHKKLSSERGYEYAEIEAYRAARKEGLSVEDAKRAAKILESVKTWAERADGSAAEHLSDKLSYENLVIHSELLRTQESSLRKMRIEPEFPEGWKIKRD